MCPFRAGFFLFFVSAVSGCAGAGVTLRAPGGYDYAEAILGDWDRAVSRLKNPEAIRFPFTAYYACRAMKSEDISECEKIDSRLPFQHEYAPTCKTLVYQAKMLSGEDVDSCVELSRLREAGRRDADSPQEAARYCRGLLAHYAQGDPGRACDFMFSEDQEYGADHSTGRKITREECVAENIFLFGDPVRCDSRADPVERSHCRAKAAYLSALRRDRKKIPNAAEGTLYAAALDPSASCEAAGVSAARAYEEAEKNIESPEDIVENYRAAVGRRESKDVLDIRLSNYFACQAFREGGDAPCSKIDPFMSDAGNRTDIGGSHCKEEYYLGKTIAEAIRSLPAHACVKSETERGAEKEEAEDYCGRLAEAIRAGEAENVCAVVHEPGEDSDPRSVKEDLDADRCADHFAGIGGDASRCAGIRPVHQEHCQAQARLVQALKSGRGGQARGTHYEPLAESGGGCSGPGEEAMREFRRGSGEPSPGRFATVDEILSDYPRAMDAVDDVRTINQLLSEYLVCRAFRLDSAAPCDRVDKFLKGKSDTADIGASHCREEFFQGRMIRDAFRGYSVATCVESETSEGAAQEEAEAFCRELTAAYARKDPAGVCSVIHDGHEPESDEPDEMEDAGRCRKHHLGLAGREDLCAELEGLHREHCRHQAGLVRALSEKAPELAAETMYAPVADSGASCAPMERRAVLEYNRHVRESALRRSAPPTRYSTVEAMLADYDNVLRNVPSSVILNRFVVDYMTCEAFRTKSDANCSKIDRYLPRAAHDPYMCRTLYTEGYMLMELAGGSGSVSACVADDRVWGEYIEPESDGKDSEKFCRDSIPYLVQGDLKGYCRFVQQDEEGVGNKEKSAFDWEKCMVDYAYMTGDPENCSLYGGDALMREYCMHKARLLRAARTKNPGSISETYFAPLMIENVSCRPLANRALKEYDKMLRVGE